MVSNEDQGEGSYIGRAACADCMLLLNFLDSHGVIECNNLFHEICDQDSSIVACIPVSRSCRSNHKEHGTLTAHANAVLGQSLAAVTGRITSHHALENLSLVLWEHWCDIWF